PGNDDALAHVGQAHHHVNQRLAQKLRFVDANDFSPQIDLALHLSGGAHAVGVDAEIVMGNNVVAGITLVDYRLEYLYPLAGNPRPAQPPDQLFTLTAEHGTTNHFDPTQIAPHCIHSTFPWFSFSGSLSALGISAAGSRFPALRDRSRLLNGLNFHPTQIA